MCVMFDVSSSGRDSEAGCKKSQDWCGSCLQLISFFAPECSGTSEISTTLLQFL